MPTTIVAATESLTWPDRGPYQPVGAGEQLGSIPMPVPVVQAVRRRVISDPAKWHLYSIRDSSGQHQRIINVLTSQGYLSLLVAHGTWTILTAPTLNQVLEPMQAADLQNPGKTEAYFCHIIELLKHYRIGILDLDFRRQLELDGLKSEWVFGGLVSDPKGQKKLLRELLALCHDWEVSRQGEQVAMGGNVVNPEGGVEHWTFLLRVNQAVQLTGVQVRPVRKENTFFFPMIF